MLTTTLEKISPGNDTKEKNLRVSRPGKSREGRPPLLLLHGYPETLQIWSRVAPLLAESVEVIAFDWPGLGQSEPWPGGTTPSHMANRLLRLLDHWRIDRAHIAALDMGAQPALVFAAEHPLRVEKLVVMNSLVLWDEKTSWEIALLRKLKWNQLILRRLPRLVFGRALRTFLPRGERLPEEVREDFWSAFGRVEVRKFLARMCAGYQASLPDLPDHYRRIECSTLVLWGEKDRHFPPAHARRLAELIPGSRLRIFADAGHWMPWNRSDEVAGAVAEFLAAE